MESHVGTTIDLMRPRSVIYNTGVVVPTSTSYKSKVDTIDHHIRSAELVAPGFGNGVVYVALC